MIPDPWIRYLGLALGTALTTIALTWVCRRFARSIDFMAYPSDRKVHTEPIPYMGGVAVYLGTFLPLLVVVGEDVLWKFALLAGVVTLIGLVDDYWDVSGRLKLLALSGTALVATQLGFVSSVFYRVPYGDYLDPVATVLWAVFLISAFNALDNMDGLAPGVALIGCSMFFIVGAVQFSQPTWAALSVAFTGALAGFLVFNFHPASIFLGDAGSYLIGFSLAFLSVMGNWSNHPLKAMIIPIVILSVPLFDLAFLIAYRYLTGVTNSLRETIEYSARDHISHRIQQAQNFGIRRTVIILYVFALIAGIIGVIMRNTHPFEALLSLITVGLMYGLIILLLLPNLQSITWRWAENR